jgi:hypothetical protein
MARFRSILASLALAAALAPIAANATTMTSLDYVRIAAHNAISGPLLQVQHAAACDAAAAPRVTRQSAVVSGWTNQLYPDSVGG